MHLYCAGHHHLVKINPMSEYDYYTHKSYCKIISLSCALHKNQERRHEIQYQIQVKQTFIGSLQTHFEIDGFLRNITKPLQHKLVKPQISPKDRKCKHVLSKILDMFPVYEFQLPPIFKIDHKQGN